MSGRRISKEELKEDKFVETVVGGFNYAGKHTTYIIGVALAVIIIAGAVWGFFYYRSSNEKKAVNILGIAQLAYRGQAFQEASDSLNVIVTKYASTKAAKQARFMLGHLYYAQGKFDDAIKSFEEYLKNPYKDDKDLVAASYFGIAACHEEKGEFAIAADKYYEVYEKYPTFFDRESALIGAARANMMANNAEKSIELYTKFIDEYKNSAQLADAQFALATIQSQMM